MTQCRGWKRASVWLAGAAVLPGTAAAQSNSAAPQTTPPITFSLPPSARPTPAPIPTSGPIVAPFSRPTPSATPSILRIPTPTVTATPAPAPTASATARRPAAAAPTPAASPTSTSAPQPTTAAPTTTATPEPVPVVTAVPESAAPTPAAAPAVEGPSTGLLIGAGAVLLVLVAAVAFLLGRRRGAREEVAYDEIAPAPPVAAPEPTPIPTATPAPRRTFAEEPQPRLEIVLTPKRAGTNLMSAAVDYRVTIRNAGPVAARDIRFGLYLFSASAGQAQDLQTIFSSPVHQPAVAPFDLGPGGDIELSGMAVMPRDQINVMTIEGRPWFVPVLAMKAEYRWGDNVGAPGVATAAHMIGIDRGEGAKMAPFRLDEGPHMHPEVAERKVA